MRQRGAAWVSTRMKRYRTVMLKNYVICIRNKMSFSFFFYLQLLCFNFDFEHYSEQILLSLLIETFERKVVFVKMENEADHVIYVSDEENHTDHDKNTDIISIYFDLKVLLDAYKRNCEYTVFFPNSVFCQIQCFDKSV